MHNETTTYSPMKLPIPDSPTQPPSWRSPKGKTHVVDKIMHGAQEIGLTIEEFLNLLLTNREWFQELTQDPRELISRAANYTCNCGYLLPSTGHRHPDAHKDTCPYRKLFEAAK